MGPAPRSSSSSPSSSPRPGTPPRNKIRFLWFGGEEDGLVGSQYYAAHLSDAEVARIDMMLDTDMIASPNFARLVYDGDGSTFGSENSGPPGSGTIERVLTDYWAQRGMVSEPIPFDGRSDYVGFINRGIPAGGVFAGAEAPKTAAQVAKYGGVQGEQLDPCYHEACDTYSTVTTQPPASTMNTFPTDPVLGAAAGGQPERQRAPLAGAVQEHARARRLVLRARQGRLPGGGRRECQEGRAHPPVQVPGPRGRSHALIRSTELPPRRPRRAAARSGLTEGGRKPSFRLRERRGVATMATLGVRSVRRVPDGFQLNPCKRSSEPAANWRERRPESTSWGSLVRAQYRPLEKPRCAGLFVTSGGNQRPFAGVLDTSCAHSQPDGLSQTRMVAKGEVCQTEVIRALVPDLALPAPRVM